MFNVRETTIDVNGACREGLVGLPKLKPEFTVDQYLAYERESFERNIYLDGQIYSMAGESPKHGTVSVNVIATVAMQLKGTPCQAFTKDTKVRSGPTPMLGKSTRGMFSYPDIVVVCGEVEYHDAHKDVILNPKAIIEILSDSTEAFDRGEKFNRYDAWNPTLTDYVLISQDQPQIEHFWRQQDGTWSRKRYAGIDSAVVIASIGCVLKFSDVYDRIDFGQSKID
jgi:Uma2 family endonuclease